MWIQAIKIIDMWETWFLTIFPNQHTSKISFNTDQNAQPLYVYGVWQIHFMGQICYDFILIASDRN